MNNKSHQYTTIIDHLVVKFAQSDYAHLIHELEDYELTEIFNKLAEPITNDFWEFYDRKLEFDVSYDTETQSLVFDPKNVLAAAALYRSFDDVWTFYDPENDIYEDGFLRIFYDIEADKVVIIDYLGIHTKDYDIVNKRN